MFTSFQRIHFSFDHSFHSIALLTLCFFFFSSFPLLPPSSAACSSAPFSWFDLVVDRYLPLLMHGPAALLHAPLSFRFSAFLCLSSTSPHCWSCCRCTSERPSAQDRTLGRWVNEMCTQRRQRVALWWIRTMYGTKMTADRQSDAIEVSDTLAEKLILHFESIFLARFVSLELNSSRSSRFIQSAFSSSQTDALLPWNSLCLCAHVNAMRG